MSAPRHQEVRDELEALVEAQREWERAGIETRARVLVEAGRELARRRDDLDRGLHLDGLSQKLADYYGDWIVHQGSEALLRRYAKDLVRWHETETGAELFVRRPDGVVLLVTPANSPTISAATLFSILLPGNGVVARSPKNDIGLRFLAHEIIGTALERNGFSSDLIHVAVGKSRPILDEYLPRPEVRTVVFFGNSTAGRSVAQRCHDLDKKAVLELDGSDHMVVWKDADLDGAIESATHAFDFSTQPCPIPKHLLVHHEVYPRFVSALRDRLPALSVTAEADPVGGNLVPVARPEAFFEALKEVENLGHVGDGGFRMNARGERDPKGVYVAPTLVELEDEVVLGRPLRCFDDEIFFPLIPVVRFSGPDEVILRRLTALIDASPFGLRCSIWTEDPALIAHFAREVGSVGLLLFNDDHAQCPSFASPWGGPKRSGGPHGESHLFWEKTSHLQAIGANRLAPEQLRAVVEGLGLEVSTDEDGSPSRLRAEDRPTLAIVPSSRDDDRRPASVAFDGDVATIVLNRPERHNAIDPATKDRLLEIASEVDRRVDQLRAVVLTGEGASFCSGGDLDALSSFSAEDARRFMSDATWAFRRFADLSVPVIALVRGYCLGGGLELALHCDLILADATARFGFPETAIGLVTTAGSVDRICRAVGERRAREMLLLGRQLASDEAEAAGLVAEVSDDLWGAAERRIARLRRMPREGLAAMKGLADTRVRSVDQASWAAELEAFEVLFRARERRERDA